MRRFSLLAVTAVAVAALGTTAAAQGRGAGNAGKAPTKTTNVGASAPKGGGRTTQGASGAKGGAKATGTTAKTTQSAQGGPKKSTTTTSASTSTSTSSGSGTSGGSSTSTTTTATTGTTTTFEPNAISTKISQNPNQLARVKGMLPPNMTIEEASAGFRNQGQFIAALNASKNRQIDFVQLKEAMTVDGLSLGQAAKQVRNAPAPEPAPPTGGTTDTGTTGTGTTDTGTTGTGTTGSDTTTGSGTTGSGTSGSTTSSSTSGQTVK